MTFIYYIIVRHVHDHFVYFPFLVAALALPHPPLCVQLEEVHFGDLGGDGFGFGRGILYYKKI
jgi:hypothetical protein